MNTLATRLTIIPRGLGALDQALSLLQCLASRAQQKNKENKLHRKLDTPEPIALIPDGSDPIILIGPEMPVTGLDFGNISVLTYWYQTYETVP